MEYDQHRYKGFIVKVIFGGCGWRAVVCDPMKMKDPEWKHFALSGVGDRSEALKRSYEYVDGQIAQEQQALAA